MARRDGAAMETLIFLPTDRAPEDGLGLKKRARKRPAKGKGTKGPGRPGSRSTIIFLMIVIAISLVSWEAMQRILRPHMDEFTTNAYASFVSFLIVPAISLAIRMAPKWKFDLGTFDRGFLISLAVYLIFGVWIIAYYPVNPHYFKKFDLGSWEYLSYVVMVALYVMPVDFMTKRVIQYEMSAAFGTWNGYWVGTVAWMVGHVLEVVWLSELMGPAGSTTFIVVSGLVTGWLYMKYKNVLALMTGHWAINIMISIVTSYLH